MATLPEIDSFVQSYLKTVQFPDGFKYTARLYNDGKFALIMYRNNVVAFDEKELVAITTKVSSIMQYLRANGINAVVEVENVLPT